MASGQSDKIVDGTTSSQQLCRPVLRRRDLKMFPSSVQPPSAQQPLTLSRVTFQPSEDKEDSMTERSEVRNSVATEDTWSCDEDEKRKDFVRGRSAFDDDVVLEYRPTSNSCNDPVATMLDKLYGSDDQKSDKETTLGAQQSDDRCWDKYDGDIKRNDLIRGRIGFDDDVILMKNSNSCSDPVETMLDRLYGSDDQQTYKESTFRDPHSDDRCWDKYLNENEYSDMVDEWKRHAFQFIPNSYLLNDGDQVIRVEGEDGSGSLLYDLASCR